MGKLYTYIVKPKTKKKYFFFFGLSALNHHKDDPNANKIALIGPSDY